MVRICGSSRDEIDVPQVAVRCKREYQEDGQEHGRPGDRSPLANGPSRARTSNFCPCCSQPSLLPRLYPSHRRVITSKFAQPRVSRQCRQTSHTSTIKQLWITDYKELSLAWNQSGSRPTASMSEMAFLNLETTHTQLWQQGVWDGVLSQQEGWESHSWRPMKPLSLSNFQLLD